MIYHFIEQNKQVFPIRVMCHVFDVAESGFYAWRQRPTSRHQREDAHLQQEIKEVFHNHCGRYGSPRLHKELSDRGMRVSRKQVARLMQEAALSARPKRRRLLTTKRDLTRPVAQNLLNRSFSASQPNEK